MAKFADSSDILRMVNHYDCLTAVQLMRRYGYAASYLPDMRHILRQMTKRQLLERKLITHPTSILGHGGYVYKVGPKGKHQLREEGLFVPDWKMGHESTLSMRYWHTLWLNDFFITMRLWADTQEEVVIHREMHEFDFIRAKNDFKELITWADGTKHDVLPDGFIDMSIGKERFCFLIELETGSQAPVVIGKKVKTLALFLGDPKYSPLAEKFGVDYFTAYLFLAKGVKDKLTPDNHRKMILRTIAETLRGLKKDSYAEYFKVTALPPDDLSLFTARSWFMPNDYEPHGLLD